MGRNPAAQACGCRGSCAVALTCSELRAALHRNVRALDLTTSCSRARHVSLSSVSQEEVERLTATLPERFPSCQLVQLRISDSNYLVTQALLTAVSR